MSRIQNVAIAVLFIITTVSAQAGSKVKGPDGSDIDINNSTPPIPIPPVTEINNNLTTVTPKPDTTTSTTHTPTVSTTKPTEKTTVPTPTSAPTTISTTTIIPSTTSIPTTLKPNATTVKPTGAPPTTPVPSHRRFDGPSFIGGIVLALGLVAIGFVAFKFYKARTELNYHTL